MKALPLVARGAWAVLILFMVGFFALSAGAHTLGELNIELEKGFADPTFYSGSLSKEEKLGKGPRCEALRRWKLRWSARTDDAKMSLHENGRTTLHIELSDSWFFAESFERGGLICRWTGGGAKVWVKKLSAEVELVPEEGAPLPWVDIRGLSFSKLKVENIVLQTPVFKFETEKAPPWLTLWMEKNLRNAIAGFLKSQMRDRLDKILNQELRKKLQQYREQEDARVVK